MLISNLISLPFLLTSGLAGFVENLSLFSPCSSKSSTTLSTVHTASLLLLGAQARAVTLDGPSCEERMILIIAHFSKQSLAHLWGEESPKMLQLHCYQTYGGQVSTSISTRELYKILNSLVVVHCVDPLLWQFLSVN